MTGVLVMPISGDKVVARHIVGGQRRNARNRIAETLLPKHCSLVIGRIDTIMLRSNVECVGDGYAIALLVTRSSLPGAVSGD